MQIKKKKLNPVHENDPKREYSGWWEVITMSHYRQWKDRQTQHTTQNHRNKLSAALLMLKVRKKVDRFSGYQLLSGIIIHVSSSGSHNTIGPQGLL